ncbi:hypothetical protein AMST5_00984 [freshwater sediment metagenome]|uniref:ParB/Sulfiredoxin domain-containing protein n=1 Tax=freshwater sediment metagenome TaxID=556182 RepID=A0AA48LXT6_9ZZZZ
MERMEEQTRNSTMMMKTEDLAKLEDHPVAKLFPMLAGELRATFLATVREAGKIEVPVTLIERDGKQQRLDGRNRVALALEAGVEMIPVEIFEGDDTAALALALRRNFVRRHQVPGQRALVTARLTLKPDSEKCNLGYTPISQADAAHMAGVSRKTINVAVKVLKKAETSLIVDIEMGKTTLAQVSDYLDNQAQQKKQEAERRKDEREQAKRNAAAKAADTSEPDEGADPPDEDDAPMGEAPEPDGEAPDAGPVAEPETTPEPEPEPKTKAKKTSKAETKKTTKQKAEAEHDAPLIAKKRDADAVDAANFAADWAIGKADDPADLDRFRHAHARAVADPNAFAILRQRMTEGAGVGNGHGESKDAKIARLEQKVEQLLSGGAILIGETRTPGDIAADIRDALGNVKAERLGDVLIGNDDRADAWSDASHQDAAE